MVPQTPPRRAPRLLPRPPRPRAYALVPFGTHPGRLTPALIVRVCQARRYPPKPRKILKLRYAPHGGKPPTRSRCFRGWDLRRPSAALLASARTRAAALDSRSGKPAPKIGTRARGARPAAFGSLTRIASTLKGSSRVGRCSASGRLLRIASRCCGLTPNVCQESTSSCFRALLVAGFT